MNLKHIMLSERSQLQKIIYYIIPFIWKAQNRQIHRYRKRISGCQELEKGKWRVTAKGYWVSLGCDENVLELVEAVAQLCDYTKNYWIVHFKRTNFMVCKWHLNKAVIKNVWPTLICFTQLITEETHLRKPGRWEMKGLV